MRTVKALVALCIIGAAVYVGFKLIPPYFNNYELQDVLDTEALQSSYAQNQTDDMLRDKIIKKAKDCDVILTPQQIKITRNGGIVDITAQYTVTVDLPGYPVQLNFSPSSSNKKI